jgi:hypothetical protein
MHWVMRMRSFMVLRMVFRGDFSTAQSVFIIHG